MNPPNSTDPSLAAPAGQATAPKHSNAAVILAQGADTRMGLDVPKQFVPVAGRTSLEHTTEIFQSCDLVDAIVVLAEPSFVVRARKLLHRARFSKISAIRAGGVDRSETSYLALSSIGDRVFRELGSGGHAEERGTGGGKA